MTHGSHFRKSLTAEIWPEERAAAWAEYENERVTGYTTLQQQQQQAAQQQMLLKQAAQQQAAAAKQQALLKRQQEQQAKKLQQKMSRSSVFPSTRYVWKLFSNACTLEHVCDKVKLCSRICDK